MLCHNKLVVTILTLAAVLAGSAAAQTAPAMENDLLGRARIVPQDEVRRTDPFAQIHDMPLSESAAIIPLLQAGANMVPPAFLYELARRLWPTDRNAAFEWLALGMARARYDALRCTDKTARQGIGYLPMIAPDVVKGIELDRKVFGEAGKRALTRNDLFVDSISPMWICSHGANMLYSAIQGKPLTESDWQTPVSEWPALREQVRADLARYFDEQGKPQNDPVPLTKVKYPRQTLTGNIVGYSWLDDSRLVVASSAKGNDGKYVSRLAILGNDGSSDEVATFTGSWCAGNGIIAYQTASEKLENKTQRLIFAVGQPGKWKQQSIEMKPPIHTAASMQTFSQSWSLPVNSVRQSPFDCRWENDEQLSGPRNAIQWLPLLPGDGAIQFDPPDARLAQRGVSWVQPTGESRRLPLSAHRLTLVSFRHYGWRKAYFVTPSWSRFDPDGDKPPACVPAAWIYPSEQRVEDICVPFDTANTSNTVVFLPSRVGWLRIASTRNTAHGPKPGGIYLVRNDGKAEKLLETNVISWNPSPDGCRLAFRHHPDGNLALTLEVIDLCQPA